MRGRGELQMKERRLIRSWQGERRARGQSQTALALAEYSYSYSPGCVGVMGAPGVIATRGGWCCCCVAKGTSGMAIRPAPNVRKSWRLHEPPALS